MHWNSDDLADKERITDFSARLFTWALKSGKADDTEICREYATLLPVLKRHAIQPQEVLTELYPYSAAFRHLAQCVKNAKKFYGQKDEFIAEAGNFRKGMDFYNRAVFDEIAEKASDPNYREISAQVEDKIRHNRGSQSALSQDMAGLMADYDAKLRFVKETILQSMNHLSEPAIAENVKLNAACEQVAIAWALAGKENAENESAFLKRFEWEKGRVQGLESLLEPDGLACALEGLEIALRAKGSVYKMQDINLILRAKMREDPKVAIDLPVNIEYPSGTDEINARIQKDPLISRYDAIKNSLFGLSDPENKNTSYLRLGDDGDILKAFQELSAAVTLASFRGKENEEILEMYMQIVEKVPGYNVGLTMERALNKLNDRLEEKNIGGFARQEIMRKVDESIHHYTGITRLA